MPDDTLLPPNATELERAVVTACTRSTSLNTPLREIWSPADCPTPLLPWLAWAFRVEEWDGRLWSPEQQRDAIAVSIPVKRQKGTIGAVQAAIRALGLTARVQEWWAQIPAGPEFTYRLLLEVDQVGFDEAQLARLLLVVERAKNLRSHLDKVVVSAKSKAPVVWAAVVSTGHEITVRYDAPTYTDGSPAFDLMTDAALHGEASTVAAITRLGKLMNDPTPTW